MGITTWIKASDLAVLLITSALIHILLTGVLFSFRGRLERDMSMARLDRLLKKCLVFGFLLTPVWISLIFFCKLYRHIGSYDGISVILEMSGSTLGSATPYGNHWSILFLLFVWLLGFGVFGPYRYGKDRGLIKRLKETSAKDPDTKLQEFGEEVRRRLGVKKEIPVLKSGCVDVPFTTGVLRPIVFLPQELPQQCLPRDSRETENVRFLIEHELLHCKKRDCLYRELLFWMCALYWFNPFLPGFARYFIEVNEMACDEGVLEGLGAKEKACYAELLVNLQCGEQLLQSTVSLADPGKSFLEKRLEHMKTGQVEMKKRRLTVSFAALLSACSMTVLAASSGAAELQSMAAEKIYQGREVAMTGDAVGEGNYVLGPAGLCQVIPKIRLSGVRRDSGVSEDRRTMIGSFELSAGDEISVVLYAGSPDAAFCVGYMDSSGKRTYVRSESGEVVHLFHVSEAGTYTIFADGFDMDGTHMARRIH